jgi:ABC-type nitrate/sulfonate/bicarbonate transport system substrate-binding protein
VFAAAAVSTLLAACGEDEQPAEGGGGDVGQLSVGITSPTVPVLVTNRAGPIDYGPKFGLKIDPGKVTNFASHNTAVQAMLAGDFPVAGGATGTPFNLIEQGQDVKLFAPYMQKNVIWAAARPPVKSWEDLLAGGKRMKIASDGPGGGYYFVWNAFFDAMGQKFKLEDQFDLVILEEPPQVNTGFINGDVNAALIHYLDVAPVQKELGEENMVILGKLEEDVPPMAFEAWYATTEWLDANQDVAKAFAASILTANRELSKSFDAYKAAVTKHVEGGFPGTDDELKGLWSRIRENEVWPWNELTPESIMAAATVTQASGGLKDASKMSNALDPRPNQAALAEIGRVEAPAILG